MKKKKASDIDETMFSPGTRNLTEISCRSIESSQKITLKNTLQNTHTHTQKRLN